MSAALPITHQRMLAKIAWYRDYLDGAMRLAEADGLDPERAADCVVRHLLETDLFYLLAYVLGRSDLIHPWLWERCAEVQAAPDGHLDLWSREHYKSTIITFGKTIQDILIDPNLTIGIFSHTKPIARAFLRQIKYELETNEQLKRLYPHILWADPKKDAVAAGAQWSEEKGITVQRTSNAKEATLEAHGLVDGQPTSKHFGLLVYDDVVTLESVTSPDMIKKTTDALALSYNLGAHGGRRRWIGTRYHYNDTYAELLKRGTAIPRIHPATLEGTHEGTPVLLSRATLNDKRRDFGPYVYACQMMQDPKAEGSMGFQQAWLRYYDTEPDLHNLNIFIVVDPANEKKKESDYTSMWVVGLGPDRNYYVLDGLRDRLNLTERTDKLFAFHYEYRPNEVGYERYGMQADIPHIVTVMDDRSYRFTISELKGSTPKQDRIRRLIPLFEQGKIWLPRQLWYTTVEGKRVDLIGLFVKDEYLPFPVCATFDMLDNLANIKHPDLPAVFPTVRRRERKQSWEDRLKTKMAQLDQQTSSAMTA